MAFKYALFLVALVLLIATLEIESKSVEFIEGGSVELERAVRSTSDNALLSLIQTYLGPTILLVQQGVNEYLNQLLEAVAEFKSADIYPIANAVLSSFGLSGDTISNTLEELIASLNEIFELFTGVNLSSS